MVKNARIVNELKSRGHNISLINTGQHSDFDMNQVFVEELGLGTTDYDLKIGGRSLRRQLAMGIVELDKVLKRQKPKLVLVLGDTNSTLAGALASVTRSLPLAHVEAGCRSFDWRMPEELNRVFTDHVADLLFAPTLFQKKNLTGEGVDDSRIHVVGDPTVDLLDHMGSYAGDRRVLDEFGLLPAQYYLLTVHRLENLTSGASLRGILRAASALASEFPVVLPLHPHTKRQIGVHRLSSLLSKIRTIGPQPYSKMLPLIANSLLVLTDSGGMQHEAPLLQKYCVTLRENTEWVETVQLGLNFLAGTDSENILTRVRAITYLPFPRGKSAKLRKLLGGGRASARIADICQSRLS